MEEIRLPVPLRTMSILAPTGSIYYPQIQWLKDPTIQNKINKGILKKVNRLFNYSYLQNSFTEIIGDYEIKNNQRGILSMTLFNFATGPKIAHPFDNITSLTTDVRTGMIYPLAKLFKPNSSYISRLSNLIKKQITERQIHTYEEITSIRPNQDYYISDKTLIIFFQRYEIGPRPVGYPMFPISIYEIEDIIDENGPLGKMIPSV